MTSDSLETQKLEMMSQSCPECSILDISRAMTEDYPLTILIDLYFDHENRNTGMNRLCSSGLDEALTTPEMLLTNEPSYASRLAEFINIV